MVGGDTMAKKIWVFSIMAMFAMMFFSGGAFAAVTECLGQNQYNDTGVTTDVSAGNVCIDATDYDVNPTAGVNCDTWYELVAGACSVQDYYVGYAGDGSLNCVDTDWVSTGVPGSTALGQRVNTTINASSGIGYVSTLGDGTFATPAKDACANVYTLQGPTGYCDGAGALDTDSSLANVTAGNVCIAGVDSDPTGAVKCGEWTQCVAGACSAPFLYVGFSVGNATGCVGTDAQAGVGTGLITSGYRITTTENASSCTIANTGGSAAYSSCTNLYTRNGTSGYCDGAGAQEGATVHVIAGKICYGGANTAPNGSLNCGTWSNCVADATTAAEYWVGYAGSGTSCSATAWVSAGTTQTATPNQRWTATETVDTCTAAGYVYTYDKTDLQPIVVDGLGTAGAEVVSWIDMMVLLIIVGFIIGMIVKAGNMFK